MLHLAEADRRLFLAILKLHKIKIDYVAVAAEMTDDDVICTPIAIKRRMDKIKCSLGDPSERSPPCA